MNRGIRYIGRARFEYLLGERWSVGGAANVATIDVEADNISGDLERVNLRATIENIKKAFGVCLEGKRYLVKF